MLCFHVSYLLGVGFRAGPKEIPEPRSFCGLLFDVLQVTDIAEIDRGISPETEQMDQ